MRETTGVLPSGSRRDGSGEDPAACEGMRKQFTFYASFYRSLRSLPQRWRPITAMAIIEYGLFGRVETRIPEQAQAMLELITPVLDSAKKRAAAGRLGGLARADRQQTTSCAQANARQTASEGEIENETENETENEIEQDSERSLCAQQEATVPLSAQTAQALQAVEQAVGPLLPEQREQVLRFAERCGVQTVLQAVQLGKRRGAKSWNYLRRMLEGGLSGTAQPVIRSHEAPLSAMMKEAVLQLMEQSPEEAP